MGDVRVNLELRRLDAQDAEQEVYFKVDGGRFENDKTIKLTQDTKYKLNIVCKPPLGIRSVEFN